ncbi:MAG: pantoate--beta-alanine ligase [Marinifilaceae bacterium]
MKVIKLIPELQEQLGKIRKEGKSIGLVPTMGALHKGHISLVEQSVRENDYTVVSIFVNPTQFNNPNDLKTYPRTLEEDLEKLQLAKADFIFVPTVEEMYPEPDTRQFNFGPLEQVMEGKHRPGHFNGVAQIVSKLFAITEPHKAYFGQKDFQQVAVIKQMVKDLEMPLEIVACPIIREKDGLAMSSRNMLLQPDERKNASHISQTLAKACNLVADLSVEELKQWVIEEVNKNPYLEVEYFEIVDDTYLQPVANWSDNSIKVGCITVQVGKVRLIDNITFKI